MRYIITAPVLNGLAWWRIADTHKANQTMADFFKHMPHAEKIAKDICKRLNSEGK